MGYWSLVHWTWVIDRWFMGHGLLIVGTWVNGLLVIGTWANGLLVIGSWVIGYWSFVYHRLLVLGKLNALVKKWIYEVSIEKVRGVSVGVVGVLLG
jgi:hypothetical protein